MKRLFTALLGKVSYGRLFALALFAAMVLVPTIGPQAAESSYDVGANPFQQPETHQDPTAIF